MTFGDDGEKFGTWPDTKSHVYEQGWLRSFFDALTENADWLHTVTLGEAIRRTPPIGKVYLPDCSYREMTEWSLPVEAQETFDAVVHAMEDHPQWADLKSFVRGGYWRNFKTKYDETNEMYARMMYVSRSDWPQPKRAESTLASWQKSVIIFIAVNATVPIGMEPSAASICLTCATRSTVT